MTAEVLEDVGAARPEERAKEPRGSSVGVFSFGSTRRFRVTRVVQERAGKGGFRRHHGETARTGAAEQTKEEGLGPIIGCVPGGDGGCARGERGLFERSKTSRPGAGLEV